MEKPRIAALRRNNADDKKTEDGVRDPCLVCADSDYEEKQPPHDRADCMNVMYNFCHNCERCRKEDLVGAYYQCAQCRPAYELCVDCFYHLKNMAADPYWADKWENEHTLHSFNKIEKVDRYSPVLVTENLTVEVEPPELVCVDCLLLRHQDGRKCRWQ